MTAVEPSKLPANSGLSSWIAAARPRTLSLSIVPVVVGAALAWAVAGKIQWGALLAVLCASVLVQIGTNLYNDAADARRGGDGPDRVGPPRVTAQGLLTAAAVTRAAVACFALTFLVGLYPIYVGGWPILVLVLLAVLSGWVYTGGPWPIAYTPLGEVFVAAFFGLGAVCGTYWVCAAQLDYPALVTGMAIGLFASAVLTVNNHRDAEADTRVGRRTLAIIAGPRLTAWIYTAQILVPFALVVLLDYQLPRGRAWPALLALPLALRLIHQFWNEPRGRGFNRILAQTAQTQAVFGLLLVLGLLL
jgi:1,4-dihydroxy-2-naphthoate polyprenyltransferase